MDETIQSPYKLYSYKQLDYFPMENFHVALMSYKSITDENHVKNILHRSEVISLEYTDSFSTLENKVTLARGWFRCVNPLNFNSIKFLPQFIITIRSISAGVN